MNYRTLIALLLSVVPLTAQAEERWFEVELLLFERNTDIQNFSEQLIAKDIIVDSSDSINLLRSKAMLPCVENCISRANPTVITKSEFDFAGNNFKRLSRADLELVAQRERLEKHAGFTPVLHMGWRMPVESRRTAKPLHIFAGDNLAEQVTQEMPELLIDPETQLTETNNNAHKNSNIWAIDGNFKVYLDHYLYIDTQLVIRKAITQEVAQAKQNIEMIDDENGIQIAKVSTQTDEITQNEIVKQNVLQTSIKEVLFDQNRRLRSEEIHYLDHPLMGIIVQIRKIP